MSLANDLTSFAATAVRLGRGVFPRVTAAGRPDPPKLLELYDFEGCPYCRKTREVLCELDLDYLAHPVARGSPRRAELVKRGGKMQAPYLVDPNTGTEMYESDDIIAYLNTTYGGGARAVRLGRGARCRRTRELSGVLPLILYNMEGSPYCRKVREALSELDLEHVVRNVPKGSPKRAALVDRGGKMQVPYLIDPNTDRALYESDDIVAYLEAEYA